jgi:hypothetical protein
MGGAHFAFCVPAIWRRSADVHWQRVRNYGLLSFSRRTCPGHLDRRIRRESRLSARPRSRWQKAPIQSKSTRPTGHWTVRSEDYVAWEVRRSLRSSPVNTFPDPFTFFNGTKIGSVADWEACGDQGSRPVLRVRLRAWAAASVDRHIGSQHERFRKLEIYHCDGLQDSAKTASFTQVLYRPSTGTPPYPVIAGCG